MSIGTQIQTWTDWLIWLYDLFINKPVVAHVKTGKDIDWLIDWLIGWLIGYYLVGCLIDQ